MICPVLKSSLRYENCSRVHLPVLRRTRLRCVISCCAEPKSLKDKVVTAGTACLLCATLIASGPASAELNKFEYEVSGEFGKGTALQYGEADIKGKDFSGQNMVRSNFTAADCRDCNFKDANLKAAYFIKTVVARANFENADLSDVLMDRAVMNESNLTNAILQRAVLTRSDLGGATIYGADFTNALVDKTQQMALCRYADGVNTVTGVDTRKSLGCGSKRKFRASTPSNPEGPQVTDEERDDFKKSLAVYRE